MRRNSYQQSLGVPVAGLAVVGLSMLAGCAHAPPANVSTPAADQVAFQPPAEAPYRYLILPHPVDQAATAPALELDTTAESAPIHAPGTMEQAEPVQSYNSTAGHSGLPWPDSLDAPIQPRAGEFAELELVVDGSFKGVIVTRMNSNGLPQISVADLARFGMPVPADSVETGYATPTQLSPRYHFDFNVSAGTLSFNTRDSAAAY